MNILFILSFFICFLYTVEVVLRILNKYSNQLKKNIDAIAGVMYYVVFGFTIYVIVATLLDGTKL